jgi:hypothetical protein
MLLVAGVLPTLPYVQRSRLVNGLLDGGYRNNRVVLEEFATNFEEMGAGIGISPTVLEQVPRIVRRYAKNLEVGQGG